MVDGTTEGLIRLGATIGAGAGVIGLVLYARELSAGVVALGRRVHAIPPEPPRPVGMPLERIARDVRRIRREVRQPLGGVPVAKRRGLIAAYDDALIDACRAVEIDTTLGELNDPVERESERLRLEYLLEQAGVDLSGPATSP